jgi:hypothetical protein
MGIRIKKAIGYGLDVSDMNTDFISDFDNMESKEVFQNFVNEVRLWGEETDDLSTKLHFHENMLETVQFYTNVIWDDEFGFDDKVLLIPIGQENFWKRYDDIIDYTEHRGDDLESRWVPLKGGIYPYTGELVRKNPDKPLGIEQYWVPCYLESPEHKDAIPMPPVHLWFMIKHLKLVPEKDVTDAFLSLRPTMYIYWS